jgi:hypothetical protein
MGLVEVLQEQIRARRARIRVLLAAGDAPRKIERLGGGEARVAALKEQVSNIELLVRKLQEIDQTWSERIG